jgi:hypothetical protein
MTKSVEYSLGGGYLAHPVLAYETNSVLEKISILVAKVLDGIQYPKSRPHTRTSELIPRVPIYR